MTDKPRLRFDSRRWTGRYRPGEAPSEFAHSYRRRRSAKWLLSGILLAAVTLAVAQLFTPDDRPAIGAPFFGLALVIGRALSPFGQGFPLSKPGEDAVENALLARVTTLAYRGLTAVAVLAFGYCSLATPYGWPLPHRASDLSAWFAAFLVIAGCLPVFLAEITVPFPAPRELTPPQP